MNKQAARAPAAIAQAAKVPDGLESGVDFPIVCEVCLGPNPYLRMIKQPSSKECKVSGRVFTSFRWRPGAAARYKETVICPEVARAKGVCQCCLMDMEFNLPVGVRDALLKGAKDGETALPQSGVNQAYYYDQVARASREEVESGYGRMANEKLLKMARSSPYYDRNLPKLCSFWIKGQCSRVIEGSCPYRPCCGTFRFPELASNHPLLMQKLIADLERDGAVKVMKDKSEEMNDIKEKLKDSQKGNRDDNIRKRYHGNDELTAKYVNKAEQMDLEPPEDESITSLYVSLMGMPLTEKEIIDQFYAYGEIKSVQVLPMSNCAFVTYTTREGAETAIQKLHGNLTIRGVRLRVVWARPQAKRPGQGEGMGGIPAPPPLQAAPPPPPPGYASFGAAPPGVAAAPPPPPGARPDIAPMGYGSGKIVYPSMDPSQMGTRPDRIPPPPPGRPPPKK